MAPIGTDWHRLAAIRTKLGPNWVQGLRSNELGCGERNARAVGLLSVREVARLLSVSTPIVYRLCERGELGHVRLGNAIRIAPGALAAYLEQRRG